jgi:hypothetical protein
VVWGVESLEEVVVVECVLAMDGLSERESEGRRLEVKDFCARVAANFACFARVRGAIVKRLYVDRFKVEELITFLSFSEGP